MRDQEAALILIMIVVGCGILLVGLAIQAFICWLVSGSLKRIPEQYCEQTPGMVWLLMIPCFPLIWNFFVYPRVAASFQNYFNDNPDQAQIDVGDCGAQLAQYYCIATVCGLIPIVGGLASMAALVILILTLVKFGELKNQIPEDAAWG